MLLLLPLLMQMPAWTMPGRLMVFLLMLLLTMVLVLLALLPQLPMAMFRLSPAAS